MNTTDLVRYVSTAGGRRAISIKPIPAPSYHQLVTPLRSAVVRARQYLLSQQRADGSWRGHQCGDASLASHLVFTLAYLGRQQTELEERAAAAILEQQLPIGGWSRTSDGPVDLSTSVQAYFALKLTGHDPSDTRLSRARDTIRHLGGADAADATTRLFLALLGQVDYDRCAPVAPELLLLPASAARLVTRRCPGAGRRLLAPLAVVWSHRPVRNVPLARGVRELLVNRPADWPTPCDAETIVGRTSSSRWRRSLASAWRRLEQSAPLPLRRRALDVAESMVVRRVTEWGDCQPHFDELLWLAIALETLGYEADSPEQAACEAKLRGMMLVDEESGRAWPQPVWSTCWDTAIAVDALCASGVELDHIASADAVAWLPRLERRAGLSNTTMEQVGLLAALTCVERQAADGVLPPDIQVTDQGVIAGASMARRRQSRRKLAKRAAGLLVERAFLRQHPDGGWSAADHDRRSFHVCPSSRDASRFGGAPDVSGAVLIALALHGHVAGHPAVDRAIAFLRAAQRADGSWDSATGVRFTHGTSLAVRGLVAVGVDADDPAVAAGLNWLVVHQQPSGGWGETAQAGTAEAHYLSARPTATQTAWALLAFSAAGQSTHDAACRGVHFLVETQEDDGRWDEPHFTLRDAATGRWYRNDLYSVTSPLMALSRWVVAAAAGHQYAADRVPLRLVGADARG